MLDVITKDVRTNAIVKYYQEYRIRQTLSTWKSEERWAFLDKVKIEEATFNAYKAKPNLVSGFYRFRSQGSIEAYFKNANNEDIIKLLDRYGDCSDEALILIRDKAEIHIKHLLRFDEPTHNIAYFYQRRADLVLRILVEMVNYTEYKRLIVL